MDVHSLKGHFPPIIWQQMTSSPSQFSSGLLPRNVEKEVTNQLHRHKTSNEIYQSWAQRFQPPRTNKPWHRNGTDGHIKKRLRSNPFKLMCLCPLTSFQQKILRLLITSSSLAILKNRLFVKAQFTTSKFPNSQLSSVFFCCFCAYTLAPCLHNCFRMPTRNGKGAYTELS